MYDEKECQATQKDSRPTLMLVLERLENKCEQLREVAEMTEKLNQKLNRNEGDPKPEKCQLKESNEKNIVELFDNICDRMDEQMITIANNTDRSMGMIE
jgi:hypothetical protein